MKLNTLTFRSLVSRFAAAAQASVNAAGLAVALDFTVGSVYRAMAEAQASVLLWLQWQILRVLSMTRGATSTGEDVDSFVADFGLTRQPAVPATGSVVLSRYTPTLTALVQPGAAVKTADGTQTFVVVADTSNPLWSDGAGVTPGYVIPAGQASAAVPVQAAVGGTGGNVAAGSITLLASALPGVDTASNPAAFVNGIDAESDTAVLQRFRAFLGSLSKGTAAAVILAAQSVQQGLSVQVAEGVPRLGAFTVYVDDGTGSPASSLLALVYQAVDAVRAVGIAFAVKGPTRIPANVAVTLDYVDGADEQAAEAAVQFAVTSYINALGFGQTLSFLRLAQVIQDASPDVADISTLLLNGGGANVTAGVGQIVRAVTVTVS